MLFQELPNLGATPVDNTEILVGNDGTLAKTGNLFAEIQDAEIIRLVLNKITPSTLLNNHLTDTSLHRPINDAVVSTLSTWSSDRVNSAVNGSSPWFNLDNVPEGTVNKYWTDERAKAVIAATTQGISPIDHKAIATQLVSVLMGFNDTLFRYEVYGKTTGVAPISVSINGGPPTFDYFEVKPGVNEIVLSTGGSGYTWVCKELAHQITNLTSGVKVITPRLTLDSFTNGTTNKFWSNTTFGGSPLATQISNHLTNPTFTNLHPTLSDFSISTTTTWSSSKVVNYVASELAKNRATIAANTKAVSIIHEVASSGANATGYVWDSVLNAGVWTHYIIRPLNTSAYTNLNYTLNNNIQILPGTWLIYWEADMTLRSGLFAGVNTGYSYFALSATPRVPVLTAPGVVTNTGTSGVFYRLMSRFNTTTAYSSSFKDTWLQPQSISGVNELYATLHIERVR